MISGVRAHFDGILIVGGGITDAETATTIANAGADILVVGTLIEKKNDWEEQFSKIISSIRK
jgi:phosphoglycerol geranylgeranyltransferase